MGEKDMNVTECTNEKGTLKKKISFIQPKWKSGE